MTLPRKPRAGAPRRPKAGASPRLRSGDIWYWPHRDLLLELVYITPEHRYLWYRKSYRVDPDGSEHWVSAYLLPTKWPAEAVYVGRL